MVVDIINRASADEFVRLHHYAVTPAPITQISIGLFVGNSLLGVSTWGYGTRPLHTIRKLFPDLTSKDYLELGRLCVSDALPRNTESQFLRHCRTIIKNRCPGVKLLFSWADGLRGKPGYVYQADNWLYGGYIVSEFYTDAAHRVIHPRLLITKHGTRTQAFTKAQGLTLVRGMQLRYVRFLCNKRESRQLLKSSAVDWHQPYLKTGDLRWWVHSENGYCETTTPPVVHGSAQPRRRDDKNQLALGDDATWNPYSTEGRR